MLTENLALLFERDIQKLKAEITAYRNEDNLWKTAPGISNPGGNLCLHLLGNLQHYIGGILGNSGYVRNRPEEFSLKNIPVPELVEKLDHVCILIPRVIRSLSNETMEKDYAEKVFDYSMTTEYFLLHLLAHLNYHLGQVNYHRRMLDI